MLRPRHSPVCLALTAALACTEPAPAPDGPLAPSPATTATPELAEPPAVEPTIVAYSTPVVDEVQVVRKGPKVQIRLRWDKVDGAHQYEVQVSKVLTFSRATAGVVTARPRFASRWMEPSVYFWRVRATGDAGLGSWTDVQIVDGTQTNTQTGPRGRRPPRTSRPVEAPEPAEAAPDPNTPPLRLVWHTPMHQAIITTNAVTLEGVATRGTIIEVPGNPPVTVDATFAVPVKLAHGRNDLVVVGKLGGQTKRLERSVYYADPTKLAPIRSRFEALKRQLEEIAAVRDELNETINTLDSRIKKTPEEAGVSEMKAEIERITQIRKEIDGEVGRAIKELDRLLGG